MIAPLSLEKAQTRLLALAEPLEAENVQIDDALGRYLARPITAKRTQPPADLSAMDGYAISGPPPWILVGESKCGAPFTGAITTGEAVRISTGALMPSGADRILLQEDAGVKSDKVLLQADMPALGAHIRRAGFDFRSGAMLLDPGSIVGAAQIALILSAGQREVDVRRKPIVTFIDSGDELAPDPQNCGPHQIPASNGSMLMALTANIPCETRYLGPIPDSIPALLDGFHQSEPTDVIVTSGGASVGDHDLIRPALEAWGAQIDFWRVAIKPGKPLLVAKRGKQIILGLPGNPVSSYATAFLFLLPLLRHLSGANNPLPRKYFVRAGSALPATGPRREFLRAVMDTNVVTPLSEQDSSALRALAKANALIERPENSAGVKAGTDVPIYLLQNG